MGLRLRVLLGWGALASVAAATGGCGWLLGLDEFTDQPQAGAGCTSAEQCPTGEHGSPRCESGTCGFTCEEGFADCTDAPGCETSTTSDRGNCGGCGVSCAALCVEGSCNDPVDIAAGGSHACAILEDGSLWCWGAEPGPGTEVGTRTHPTRVELPEAALQVGMGGGYNEAVGYFAYTCVLLENRTVRCWGRNELGQLGLGHTEFTAAPADVGLSDIRQITAGTAHMCALNMQGELFCWGHGELGETGNGGTSNVLAPALILTSVSQASAGGNHTCALKQDTSVECWGANLWGEVGLGAGGPSPVLVPSKIPQTQGYLELHCGGGFSCARAMNGVRCWGFNASGQLGINSTESKSSPTLLNISIVDQLSTSSSHAGAVVDGEVYMWGDNTYRQLGTSTALDALSPAPIGLTGVLDLALGARSSCALTASREVLCWGSNQFGQLGDGTTSDTNNPTAVVWPSP